MKEDNISKRKGIIRSLFIYLGGAWVVIEALNFFIDKYYWNSVVLDVLVLMIIFGLPALVIFLWFDGKFTPWSIILHSVNIVLMSFVVFISIARPGRLDPNQIRLLNFQANQAKMAHNIRAIAVLPFSNYTDNEGNESIILGMHDAFINELGQIGALRVISKTSALAYAGTHKTVQEIASELKVDALVEASVMQMENGIRMFVKLINAVPEQQLWSETFNSDADDFFGLYKEMVSGLAEQIQIPLSPGERLSLDQSEKVNPEAYKAFLEGKYHTETLTERGFELALECYRRSLEIDSLYAPSYAGLSFAWMAGLQMRFVTVATAIPEIYKNTMKTLSLDPDYPEAHYLHALMSQQAEWDWNKSEESFRRAISLDPNHVLAHAFFSHILMFQRRFEEAFEVLERAVQLDPRNPLVLSLYAVVRWYNGDLDEAVRLIEKAKEIQPQGSGLFRVVESVDYLKGNLEESLDGLEEIYGNEIHDFGEVRNKYNAEGYGPAMKELAEQLQDLSHLHSFYIAWFYNRAGFESETMDWLERGYEVHDPDMPYAFGPIEFRNLVSNPRYQALADKMNLPIPNARSNTSLY